MRKYSPKDDVQNKSYFSDRFYVTPELPKTNPNDDEIFASDIKIFADKFEILESYIQAENLVIYINPKDNKKAIKFLRDTLEYDFLMELSAIDYIKDRGGFDIFYEMLSTFKHKRLRLKCFIGEKDPIDSVESIFKMANWSEREMYDMYGVKVKGHHNLKRILMPDDWYDYPLRKTYPLHGDETAQWYEVDKIFGKEARDIIGPEERDAAAVDRYDTNRFARLGHEVDFGVDITDGKEPENTPISYQEEGGVKLFGKRLVKELTPEKSVTLDKRR